MVTEEERALNNVLLRFRLGNILIWLGVFTWAPFIFLRAIGETPPFLFFLPLQPQQFCVPLLQMQQSCT